jgi:RNA polymerase sigma-70 factor (ECF subfamily)
MEQRITRAKRKVAEAKVPYEIPGASERAGRLAAVAAVVYLIFNEGYAASGGEAHVRAPLCEEAIRLARLLLELFPNDAEVMGLNALLLLQHARAPARLDQHGAIVLLEEQDRSLWNASMIREGLALLEGALVQRRPGPYQVQAAIAAVHARAPRPGDTDWQAIEGLYGALERMQPSPVVTLNRAVAVSKVRGPGEALDLIEPLSEALSGYFYYYGVKGALLMQLGRAHEARLAFEEAMARANTAAEADHIRRQWERLAPAESLPQRPPGGSHGRGS